MLNKQLYSVELRQVLIQLRSIKYNRDSLNQQYAQLPQMEPSVQAQWNLTSLPILTELSSRIAVVFKHLSSQYPVISGQHAKRIADDPLIGIIVAVHDVNLNYAIPIGELVKLAMHLDQSRFESLVMTNQSLSLQVVISIDVLNALYGNFDITLLKTSPSYASNVLKLDF